MKTNHTEYNCQNIKIFVMRVLKKTTTNPGDVIGKVYYLFESGGQGRII